MTFKQKIAFEIKNLSLSQGEVYHFKWRCAVRALPFLGYKGNLKFWRGKVKKQSYLYKVFQGLDYAYYYKNYSGNTGTSTIDYLADILIDELGDELTTIYYETNDLKITNITDAINAAISSPIDERVEYAANAYSFIDASLPISHALFKENKLALLMLEDLQNIKKGKIPSLDLAIYGEVWTLFEQVLREADCAYWWSLYESIFANECSQTY